MYPELKNLYGSYEMPTEIKELFNLETFLKKDKLSLNMIGFRPVHEAYQYEITPLDVIPFADTGGDGIHFGFLTEFGQVNNLQEAPIVCVSPINDPPIRLIARNIKEFLSLATSVPYVEMLEAFCFYDSNQMLNEIKEYESELDRRGLEKRRKVQEIIRKTFNTEEINLELYFKELRAERNSNIAIETLDELGVLAIKEGRDYRTFSFHHSLDEDELERMQLFINEATTIEKLAFLRDANYTYIVAPGFDEPILQLFNELLTKLQLLDEKERLKMR